MSTQRFFLDNPFIRRNAISAVKNAPSGYICEIKKPGRSVVQNSKLWAMLNDVSNQVIWDGLKRSSDTWKHLITADLTKEEPVRGITPGTCVLVGQSTSAMSNTLFRDLIEYIYAFGVEQNVIWSKESLDVFEEYLKNNAHRNN